MKCSNCHKLLGGKYALFFGDKVYCEECSKEIRKTLKMRRRNDDWN